MRRCVVQIRLRIDRHAIAAQLEMKFRSRGAGAPHFGNFLTPSHRVFFLDQHDAVVRIGGQEHIVVLDDDHVTVGPHVLSDVHHAAIGCGKDRVAGLPVDVDALVGPTVESGEGGAPRWPDKADRRAGLA